MPFLEDGTPVDIILNPLGVPGRMNIGQVLEVHLGWAAKRLNFRAITPVFDGATETEIEAELARAWLVDEAWKEVAKAGWEWLKQIGYDTRTLRDDDEVRQLYLEQMLGPLGYDVYSLRELSNARLAAAREWVRSHGYDPDLIFLPLEESDFNRRARSDQEARRACLRLWIQSMGYEPQDDNLDAQAQEIMKETGIPIPLLGKQILRDGKTGLPYDQPVTVGVMGIMKLHHLVEDKVHARSTGPYSLVTQQPLGGKAQFGGQRFGEMEVWALEAYGAAYTLQEMLTVKSDDVHGRISTFEAIVKGEPIEEPSLPASFKVLVKELQSLGLAVEAITESGEVIRFGKEDERTRPPKIETGLLGLGEELGI
jgi:DNA-directed RNA polymerase subunit beta